MFESQLRRLGFWTAVAVPLGYPIALAVGSGRTKLLALVGLVALNLVALAVGHGYDRSGSLDQARSKEATSRGAGSGS